MPTTNPRNLRSVRDIRRRDILLSVARVPSSGRLLVASSENKVYEIDAARQDAQPVEHADHGRYVTAVRLAGHTVVSGGYDGQLIWWDLAERRTIRTIQGHTRQVRHLAVSPDGTQLASVGDDMVCRLWNLSTGARLHELRGHAERTPQHFGSMLYVCAFSNDGRRLATGDRVGHVVIWDVAAARQLAAVEAPTLYTWDGVQRIRSIGGVRGLAFSPDGTHLAIGGVGQIGNVDALQGPSRVEVFDWQRRERLYFFTGQNGIVNKLVWHPQNEWLCGIGGGGNGLILFYDPAARAMIHQGNLPMHTHDAAFSEDWATLYAVGHQRISVQELRA
jgi:WD40 repeat protein